MIFKHDYYTEKAIDLQQRERQIKAARGEIIDRNGVVLATNEAVCGIPARQRYSSGKRSFPASEQYGHVYEPRCSDLFCLLFQP